VRWSRPLTVAARRVEKGLDLPCDVGDPFGQVEAGRYVDRLDVAQLALGPEGVH
jgi:hypothetical protein